MYLDAKRILYVATAVIFSLMAWWFVQMKNSATEEMIREMETGIPSDKKIAERIEAFEQSLPTIQAALRRGDYAEAASILRDRFYAIESLSYQGDQITLSDGVTFNAWLEEKKKAWNSQMEPIFLKLVAELKEGKTDEEEVDRFFRTLPYAFSQPWNARFKEQRASIETTRAARAENWVLIRIGASMAGGNQFEEAMRPEFLKKWPTETPYTLVWGQPMSPEEEAAAGKILQVYISGETARYVRSDSDTPLAGYDLLETVTLEIIDRTRNPQSPNLNWTGLEPISVTHTPPESFYFELEREGQAIDFDSIQQKQIQALIARLQETIRDSLPAAVFHSNP